MLLVFPINQVEFSNSEILECVYYFDTLPVQVNTNTRIQNKDNYKDATSIGFFKQKLGN